MSNKPTTSVEKWNRAVRIAFEETADDLADEALAKSDAEVEAELRAAGVDLEAFDAEGDALFAKLLAAQEAHAASHADASERAPEAWTSEAPPPVARIGSRRRNTALLVAAAAAAVSAATGAAYLASQHEEEHREKPTPTPSASAAPPPAPPVKEAPSVAPEGPKADPGKAGSEKAPR